MLSKVYSAAIVGLEGVLVEVEIDIQNQGLPSFTKVETQCLRLGSKYREICLSRNLTY